MARKPLSDCGVLVTGGAGFIGSHVVDRLLEESPRRVVVVDNLFLGREENLAEARRREPSLKFYAEDASDYDAMRRIITDERIDVVFNLAVIPLPTSLERPRFTVDVNVGIATVACELLREGLYSTLIHFSSSEAYGSAQYVPMDEAHPLLPETPYAASKLAGDHIAHSYVATFGLDIAIVRPFNNFGPRQNDRAYAGVIPIVVHQAMRGEPVTIFGDGLQTRDFVYVRDTAHAAVRAYEVEATRGQVLNISTGREVAVNDLVRTILDAMDADVPVRHGDPRPGDVRRHCGDCRRAHEILGVEPRSVSPETMRETIEWYRGGAR